ncbi:hypothetical protein KR009_009251, partial [Drosophila setifemur]
RMWMVERNLPQLLRDPSRMAFCANLHLRFPRQREKYSASLVLTRDLKFYEFQRQVLIHHIDLKSSRLQGIAQELRSYNGPTISWQAEAAPVEELDSSMLPDADALPLVIGKYVWLPDEVYLLIKCWKVLVVLHRPKEHGVNFELVAEFEDVKAFEVVPGPVLYHAEVEVRFCDGTTKRCDFQEEAPEAVPEAEPEPSTSNEFPSKELEDLIQEVNALEAKLSSVRSQTQEEFTKWREQQLFGNPGQRSLLLEEKQLVRRFGDVWTRVCGDELVCGTLLVNVSGGHRLTMVHGLKPLVRIVPAVDFHYEHWLYELPLQPDGLPPLDYDELAQFWACQDQHSRRLAWRPVSKAGQLPPERSAVLLVKLSLADILQAEQIQLIAFYEVKSGGANEKPPKEKDIRQLHLLSLDPAKILQQSEAMAPKFAPNTLHQDFLAVILTQKAQRVLKLEFKSDQDCMKFQEQLVSKLQFERIQAEEQSKDQEVDLLDATCSGAAFASTSKDSPPVQRIFYNRQQLSQWCGILILRDDPGQRWHIYAQTEARMELLVHRLTSDLLLLHCNVSELEVSDVSDAEPQNVAMELDASLDAELEAWKDLILNGNDENEVEKLMALNRLQYNSDVLATII